MTLPLPETCRGCPLWSPNASFVLDEGDGRIPLLVTAEAPGEWEAEESRPLSPNGASGKVFRRALRENGVLPSQVTITNILHSRPPDNELRGAAYERGAIDHCAQYFDRVVAERQPKVILALGDIAFRELVTDRPGTVTALRGFLFESRYPGVWCVPTYHPSYIARGAWQLYGAFKSDMAFAAKCAREGVPTPMETHYELHPTTVDVQSFVDHLRRNPRLPVSYDVETASILGEEEPADWRAKRIIQIQFSAAAGHACVLPLDSPSERASWDTFARAILALPNPKWGWNSRLSDDLAISAAGWEINGERHDGMNALGHLQPSWWGKDKDTDTDKGVPSRLMGLQSATSFYCPTQFPWKHLAADPTNLQYYGAIDADMTFRCVSGILRDLESFGLMDGYRTHKLDLRPVLDYLGEIGLPVDREKQAELRTYVQGELARIQSAIQGQVPTEVLGIHPKAGYKALHSKIHIVGRPEGEKCVLRDAVAEYDVDNPPLVEAAGHIGYLKQRRFIDVQKDSETSATVEYIDRWCIERLYNPHGSSPNTKSYIRARGYRMPTKIEDTSAETTGKLELEKLAKETGDEVLRLTGEWRELFKTGMDYTGPKWQPQQDGRVHATFRWGTASGQLTAIDPPVQTYPEHSDIAKKAKGCIVAQPGHTFVKIDVRGAHARMAGWLAKDEIYYRLANLDVHSYLTSHFLKLHDAPYLLDMDDDELTAALAYIKREHQHTRNYKVKRITHGVTFGAKVKKIYGMYGPNFDPTPEAVMAEVGESRWYSWDQGRQMQEIARRGRAEAQEIINTLQRLFPRTFIVFPQWVENQIRNVTPWRLISPFGHWRTFWDFDLEQAIAYLPSNCSHCHIQAALVRLYRQGALQHFECVNFGHDSLWLHPPTELVSECIEAVQHELERPSDILVDNPLGPFFWKSDVEVGQSMEEMRTL